MPVKELLAACRRPFYAIACDRSVEEAINLMNDKKVSALIVMETDSAVGIFSERDVLRCHLRHRPKAYSDIRIADAMTNKLIVVEPGDETSAALELMIKAGIRHLPVVDQKKVVGILTINDLVRHHMQALNAELQHLQDYISDLHDAGRD